MMYLLDNTEALDSEIQTCHAALCKMVLLCLSILPVENGHSLIMFYIVYFSLCIFFVLYQQFLSKR